MIVAVSRPRRLLRARAARPGVDRRPRAPRRVRPRDLGPGRDRRAARRCSSCSRSCRWSLACALVGLGAARVGAPEGRAVRPSTSSRRSGRAARCSRSRSSPSIVVVAHWAEPTQEAMDTGMYYQDTTWYHMSFSGRFAQTGEVGPLHLTDPLKLTAWYYPQNSELLHAIPMVALDNDFLSPLINLGWLALSLLAALCIGRPYAVGAATAARRRRRARLRDAGRLPGRQRAQRHRRALLPLMRDRLPGQRRRDGAGGAPNSRGGRRPAAAPRTAGPASTPRPTRSTPRRGWSTDVPGRGRPPRARRRRRRPAPARRPRRRPRHRHQDHPARGARRS